MNRLRHFTTVAWLQPTLSATSLFDRPSAASNTIREAMRIGGPYLIAAPTS